MAKVTPEEQQDLIQEQQRWNRFEQELQTIINSLSIDNSLNMADFVIAKHVTENLKSLQKANRHQVRLSGGNENKKFCTAQSGISTNS
jgi:Mg/Co/Ni transporter MgtE